MIQRRTLLNSLVISISLLQWLDCAPKGTEPDLFKNSKSVYLFKVYDVLGSLAWHGALNKEKAIMYSVDFGSPHLPPKRIYFKIVEREFIRIDSLIDGKGFEGLGLKLIEIAPKPKTRKKSFGALERRLRRELKLSKKQWPETRKPFTGFELLISPTLTENYNLYQEIDGGRPWNGWGRLEDGTGRLEIRLAK